MVISEPTRIRLAQALIVDWPVELQDLEQHRLGCAQTTVDPILVRGFSYKSLILYCGFNNLSHLL